MLSAYSEALGIAYQIRDDLSDLGASGETNDIAGLRPSSPARRRAPRARAQDTAGTAKSSRSKRTGAGSPSHRPRRSKRFTSNSAPTSAAATCSRRYKEEAIRTLRDLENANLKGLLRRVIGKIFNDTEIKGWCKEFEQKNGVNVPVSDRPVPAEIA